MIAAVNDYLEGDELKKKAVTIKYGKIEDWNVSKVSNETDISHMFDGATSFKKTLHQYAKTWYHT